MNLSFLVHRSARNHKLTYWKKINELENVSGLLKKLDAHYGFFMLEKCFSLPKLLYFLRTSTCFNHPALLEKYDKTVRDGLPEVCNVNFDDIPSTQLALPAGMGGLGVQFASLLALPDFLASAFGADDFLTAIFSETFEHVSLTEALDKWLSLTNEQESPLDGTLKNWTQPVSVKSAQGLISRMDDKRSKVFNAHQGKFGSQWLNVVPCKNLGLKLDDQQLRISIGLHLGANICVAHTCRCGKRVERDGLQGLSCTKNAGRFSRHATLNSLIKQTLGSLGLPSMLEPRGLYRTDGKRPDGVTTISREMGKQLVWDVTVVDAQSPSRLNQGSLCNPGTTATEDEARKIEKYRELIDNRYMFQPVALEVQGSLSDSSEIFITRLCKMLCRKMLCRSTSWHLFEAAVFNGSSDRQCGLSSRNCERQRCVRRNLLHIIFFKKKPLYNCSSEKKFYWSTVIVAGMSSLLIVIFCYLSTGIVASMGFPTFVADHGCVSSPPNMMIHMALD